MRLWVWLVWNIRCRRGRRCAELIVEGLGDTTQAGATIVTIHFACGNCGSRYERLVRVEPDGCFQQLGSRRMS